MLPSTEARVSLISARYSQRKLTRRLGNTLEKYLKAISLREAKCINSLAHLPPSHLSLNGPGTYTPTRAKKLRALSLYDQISQHLAPSDSDLIKPCAWHADLHGDNIFVDAAEPTKITAIIDWQATEVAPLFLQAQQPCFLDHEGPKAVGLERPRLPADYAELSPSRKASAERLLHHQSLCVAYRRVLRRVCPAMWSSFEFQETEAFTLLVLARALLVEGEALYAAKVVDELQSSEGVLRDSGLSLSREAIEEIQRDCEGQLRGMAAMESVQATVGDLFPENGYVGTEQYDEAKDALRQCKEQIIEMYAKTAAEREAWEEAWPFDD